MRALDHFTQRGARTGWWIVIIGGRRARCLYASEHGWHRPASRAQRRLASWRIATGRAMCAGVPSSRQCVRMLRVFRYDGMRCPMQAMRGIPPSGQRLRATAASSRFLQG